LASEQKSVDERRRDASHEEQWQKSERKSGEEKRLESSMARDRDRARQFSLFRIEGIDEIITYNTVT